MMRSNQWLQVIDVHVDSTGQAAKESGKLSLDQNLLIVFGIPGFLLLVLAIVTKWEKLKSLFGYSECLHFYFK